MPWSAATGPSEVESASRSTTVAHHVGAHSPHNRAPASHGGGLRVRQVNRIGRLNLVSQASRVPVLRDLTDAYVIGLLKLGLATYGKPESASDAAHYTPARH